MFYPSSDLILQARNSSPGWRYAVIVVCLLLCVGASGQKASRSKIVAALVYNFAKNITWQAESQLRQFDIAVVTDDPLYQQEFEKLEQTKMLRQRPIRIKTFGNPLFVRQAQIIFLDVDHRDALADLLDKVEGKNVLIVTDGYADKRLVMINLVDGTDGRVHFEINRANMITQHLEINPDFILLGGDEIDVAKLYRESQASLIELKGQLDSLNKLSGGLQEGIRKSESALDIQRRHEEEQALLIDHQRDNLAQLKVNLQRNRELLKASQRNILEKENDLREKVKAIERESDNLKLLDRKLDSLNREVVEKRTTLRKQEATLKEQTTTINSQTQIVLLLLVVVVAAILVALIVFRWYWQKNMLSRLLRNKTKELEIANATLKDNTYVLQKTNKALEVQKSEILAQQNTLNVQHDELVKRQEEIEAQRDLVALQNRELELSKTIIERQNEEIKERNLSLESEVELRTKELLDYNHQLEQFAFISAHNLRAPVARILGLGQLLNLDHPDDNAMLLDKLIFTTKELDRVVRDLNTILDVKNNNAMTLSVVDLENELARLRTNMSKEISDCGAIIQTDFSAISEIRTVHPYLTSILYNLLSNAMKYRSKERIPFIFLKTILYPETVDLVVQDNGLGIDLTRYGEKLFRLYNRFHEHIEGKGLGLYLVKTQVAALGGKITVESKVGEGTIFTISLKL